jgi:outer membrane protein, heavy metal efflux system
VSRRAVDPIALETGWGWLSALWFALVALAVACVPQNAGYEDVRTMVATTGHDVRWSHVDAQDTTKEVRAILSVPLTSDGAVKLALLNNADLQATFEELGIARGELIRALRLPNPTAEGGLQHAEGESPDIELSISQDVSELILLPLRSNVAEAEFAAAKLDVAGRVMDLVLEVRKAFYEYIADQQILELRNTVLEALRASAVAAEQIHAAGNMTDLDLASQQVLYEEARVSFSSAETALATSRERLNALLGLWGPATSWHATGASPTLRKNRWRAPRRALLHAAWS